MVEFVPSMEKVSFCNSGSEAVYQAVRIARSVTGKKKIAKFEGGYHLRQNFRPADGLVAELRI